ncbi:hypothetical protein [Stenotrophomonas maltophilia]|uniref:hypothetical protein n=1 Tax=Stenotrophomonas maltophilia TaxID=40324 RepID=UPI0013DD61C2|nr:hypothetical protein [Stenotrophomonas maltophilia]
MIETGFGMTDLQIRALSAFGQIAIAAAVGVIAFRQWQTARNKLKADLFDRRVKLYDRFFELGQEVILGEPAQANLDLRSMTGDIRWVFGQDLTAKLKLEVLSVFAELGAAKTLLKAIPAGDERDRQMEVVSKLTNKAIRAYGRVPGLFAPYLMLRH